LQTEGGFVHFVRDHMGYPIASTAVVAPLSDGFVRAITRAHARFFRTGLALDGPIASGTAPRVLVQASQTIDRLLEEAKLAT
jgi:hypothetical protein